MAQRPRLCSKCGQRPACRTHSQCGPCRDAGGRARAARRVWAIDRYHYFPTLELRDRACAHIAQRYEAFFERQRADRQRFNEGLLTGGAIPAEGDGWDAAFADIAAAHGLLSPTPTIA